MPLPLNMAEATHPDLYLYGDKRMEEASLHLDTLRGTGQIIPYMIAVQHINGLEAKHDAILQMVCDELNQD